MSTTVENMDINLNLNNEEFERRVTKSLDTIAKLGDAIKGLGATGVGGISTIAGTLKGMAGTSLGGLIGEVGKLAVSFDAIAFLKYKTWDALIDYIGGKLSALGSIVDSFTWGAIDSGFSKYESLTESTQTIMAAGYSMEEAAAATEKLNWFADETSYSLTDMTSSLGKFTAQGIKMEDATAAVMGISAAAALAGQKSEAASRAMYNFAQALGVGSLQVQDWKSIEMANMATDEFRQTIIDSGLALGTLRKEADGTIRTVNGDIAVTALNFRNTLAKDWVNNDVLIDALSKYGNYANELYAITQETGMTATEAMQALADGTLEAGDALTSTVTKVSNVTAKESGVLQAAIDVVAGKYGNDMTERFRLLEEAGYDAAAVQNIVNQAFADGNLTVESMTEAYGDLVVSVGETNEALSGSSIELGGLGERAFKAAQEAKTFTDAIDATTDAISSYWAGIFQDVFGNYEEAKVVWTDFCMSLWDIFAAPVSNIKDVFDEWRELGGRETLFGYDAETGEGVGAVYQMWYRIGEIMGAVREAWDTVFPSSGEGAKNLLALTTRLQEFLTNAAFSEDQLAILKNIASGFFAVIDLAGQIIGALGRTVSIAISAIFGPMIEPFLNFNSHAGQFITALAAAAKETDFFFNGIKLLIGLIAAAPRALDNLIKSLTGFSILDTIAPAFIAFANAASEVYHAVDDFLSGIDWSNLDDVASKFSELFANIDFSGAADSIKDSIGNFFRNFSVLDLLKPIAYAFGGIGLGAKWLFDQIDFSSIGTFITDGLRSVKDSLYRDKGLSATSMIPFFGKFNDAIKEFNIGSKLGDGFSTFVDNAKAWFAKLKTAFSSLDFDFSSVLSGNFSFSSILESIRSGLFENESDTSRSISGWFSDIFGNISIDPSIITSGITGLLTRIANAIKTAVSNAVTSVTNVVVSIKTGVQNFFQPIIDTVTGVISTIKAVFSAVATVISTVVNWVSEKSVALDSAMPTLEAIGERLKAIFQAILSACSWIGDNVLTMENLRTAISILQSVMVVIGQIFLNHAIKDVGGSITSFFENFNTVLAGLDLAALSKTLSDTISAFVSIPRAIVDLLGSFTGIAPALIDSLDSLRDCMKAYQSQLYAKTLIEIAAAVAILAAAVVALSFVDQEKVGGAVVIVSLLLGELVVVMMELKNLSSLSTAGQFVAISAGMLIIAGAINVLFGAFNDLSQLDINEWAHGFIGLSSIALILIALSEAMAKVVGSVGGGKMLAASVSIGLLAVSLNALIPTIIILGEQKLTTLGKGVGALAASIIAIAGAAAIAKNAAAGALALSVLTTALLALVPVILLFGNTKVDVLVTGIVALAGALVALGVPMAILSPLGVGMLAVAAAMDLAALAILTIVTAFGEFTAQLIVLGALGPEFVQKMCDSFMVLEENLPEMIRGLAPAIDELCALIIEKAPAISEAALTLVFSVLDTIAGSAEILIAKIVEVGKALISGAFSLIGALFGGDEDPIMGLIGSIGTSLTTLGSEILPKVGEAFAGIPGAITDTFSNIVEDPEQFKEDVSTFVGTILTTMDEGIQAGLTGAADVVDRLIEFFDPNNEENKEALAKAGQGMMGDLLGGFMSASTAILQFMSGLIAAIQYLTSGEKPSLAKAAEILGAGLQEGLATIFPDLYDQAESALATMTETVEEAEPELEEASEEAFKPLPSEGQDAMNAANAALATGFQQFMLYLREQNPSLYQEVQGNVAAMQAVWDYYSKTGVLPNTLSEIMDSAVGEITGSNGAYYNGGAGNANATADGLKSGGSSVVASAGSIGKSAASEFANETNIATAKLSGTQLSSGLKSGFNSSGLISHAAGIASSMLSRVRSVFGIASPSKEMIEIGQYLMLGLHDGLSDKAGHAADPIFNCVNSAVSKLDSLNSFNPTITPIMDLSNVLAGADQISSLLGNQPTLDAAFRVSSLLGAGNDDSAQNVAKPYDGKNVVEAINGLHRDIDELGQRISGLRIMLDSGTLVGEIIEPIDQELGARMALTERGV